jgi:hypothetical protein
MSSRLNIVVGIGAIALPFAASAQMSGQSYGQPPSSNPTAQEPQSSTGSSTGLTRQANPPADTAQVAPATAADVKAGVTVHDQKGGVVGKIESVDSEGAVVSTGTTKAKIPLSAIGKGDKGLMIAMTKSELDAAAKEKKPQ